MADVFEFHDGKRLALTWQKIDKLLQLGKVPADLHKSPGGLKVIAQRYENVIRKYGERI